MDPTNRIASYVEEYRKLVYEYYNKTIPIVPTTYYRLDQNTIFDKNYMSTYRNSGPLSGKRWYKIYFYPVAFAQAVQPVMNANEKGVNRFGIETSVMIDSSYGVIPVLGDIIRFNIIGDYGVWVVTNIDYSATFLVPFYKCTITQYRLRDDIDKYLSNEYVYIEQTKRIFAKEDAQKILAILSMLDTLIDEINKLFDYRVGMHRLHDKSNIYFPELENILSVNYNIANELFPSNFTLFVSPNKYDYNHCGFLSFLTQPDRYCDKCDMIVFDYKHTNDYTEMYYNTEQYITSNIIPPIDTINIQELTYPNIDIDKNGKLKHYDLPNCIMETILNLWWELVVNKKIGAFENVKPTNFIEYVSFYCLLIRYALILYNRNIQVDLK